MIRRLIIALTLLTSGAAAFCSCPLSLKGNTPQSNVASVAVLIEPINGNGTPNIDYQADLLLTPASVMKTVTVAAALGQKGGDYTWHTTVTATGTVDSQGTLHGNLTVCGSGDPTLGSFYFKERPSFINMLRQSLETQGIKRIAGQVNGCGTWPDQGAVPSWELEDIPTVDGAGFYRLNWSDNVFSINVPSMECTPTVPGITVVKIGGSGGLRPWRNPGSARVELYGQLGKGQKRGVVKVTMPDPQSALFEAIKKVVAVEGKRIDDSGKPTKLLLDYQSPPLAEVTRSLMVRSDNQMAEATLRLLAPGKSRKEAIVAEKAQLTQSGVDLGWTSVADGSGLSRHNAVSPRVLCRVLKAMAGNADFVGSFARVGLDGTVRSLMQGVPGRENFLLKSGSMTGVVCYCGYKLDPDTKLPTHAIAIMVNNAPDSAEVRKEVSKLLSDSATFAFPNGNL